MLHENLTERIIACAYRVHNVLGPGFLEKVYENALAIELAIEGLEFVQQQPLPVYYKSVLVGDFYADILVGGTIILELKAVENLLPVHETQLVNYLATTGQDVGLLINFGRSVVVKRKHREYKPKN